MLKVPIIITYIIFSVKAGITQERNSQSFIHFYYLITGITFSKQFTEVHKCNFSLNHYKFYYSNAQSETSVKSITLSKQQNDNLFNYYNQVSLPRDFLNNSNFYCKKFSMLVCINLVCNNSVLGNNCMIRKKTFGGLGFSCTLNDRLEITANYNLVSMGQIYDDIKIVNRIKPVFGYMNIIRPSIFFIIFRITIVL